MLVGCWVICFLGISDEAPTINSPTLTITIQDTMLEITTILNMNRVLTIYMEENMIIKMTV